MRQFYDEERVFRIVGKSGEHEFLPFSGAALRPQPVERVGGSCWVIRGVTTRTKTGQASDRTWRDLTTILVVDDVIPGVREALRARFPRAKNTAQTRGAVQSLVVEVLERKLAAEIITGYDAVEVTALADEPGICLVTFGFTVTHGMDQIWLSAEVMV